MILFLVIMVMFAKICSAEDGNCKSSLWRSRRRRRNYLINSYSFNELFIENLFCIKPVGLNSGKKCQSSPDYWPSWMFSFKLANWFSTSSMLAHQCFVQKGTNKILKKIVKFKLMYKCCFNEFTWCTWSSTIGHWKGKKAIIKIDQWIIYIFKTEDNEYKKNNIPLIDWSAKIFHSNADVSVHRWWWKMKMIPMISIFEKWLLLYS